MGRLIHIGVLVCGLCVLPSIQSDSDDGYDAVVCGADGYWSQNRSDFSYGSNAWNSQEQGFQCLSVRFKFHLVPERWVGSGRMFHDLRDSMTAQVIDGSSPGSAAFDATWHWPGDPDEVHSFPHVTFSSDILPEPLSSISALRLAAGWAMTSGTVSTVDDPSSRLGFDVNALNKVDTKANVAFDMFLDLDENNSQTAKAAAYEIMIWIGQVGSPYPLGFFNKNATCYTQQLGARNFTLYSGQNSRGTTVYSWVSQANDTSFDEDILPLLQYLSHYELISADVQLGLVEFGSETFHSGGNVTFSAGDFSMEIWRGQAPKFELNDIGEDCKDPEGPGGPADPQGTAGAGSSGEGRGSRAPGQIFGLSRVVATIMVAIVMGW